MTRAPVSCDHLANERQKRRQSDMRARQQQAVPAGWPHGEQQQSMQHGRRGAPAAAFEEEQEEVEAPTRGASARPGLEPGSRRHDDKCIADRCGTRTVLE